MLTHRLFWKMHSSPLCQNALTLEHFPRWRLVWSGVRHSFQQFFSFKITRGPTWYSKVEWKCSSKYGRTTASCNHMVIKTFWSCDQMGLLLMNRNTESKLKKEPRLHVITVAPFVVPAALWVSPDVKRQAIGVFKAALTLGHLYRARVYFPP